MTYSYQHDIATFLEDQCSYDDDYDPCNKCCHGNDEKEGTCHFSVGNDGVHLTSIDTCLGKVLVGNIQLRNGNSSTGYGYQSKHLYV